MLQDILGHAYSWGLVAVLAVAVAAIVVARQRDEERRIQALGGRAQVVRTYLPLGTRLLSPSAAYQGRAKQLSSRKALTSSIVS